MQSTITSATWSPTNEADVNASFMLGIVEPAENYEEGEPWTESHGRVAYFGIMSDGATAGFSCSSNGREEDARVCFLSPWHQLKHCSPLAATQEESWRHVQPSDSVPRSEEGARAVFGGGTRLRGQVGRGCAKGPAGLTVEDGADR